MTVETLQLHFATQLYKPAAAHECERLLDSLERNLRLPWIAKTTIFLDGCEPPWRKSDVHFIPIEGRASYADFLGLMEAPSNQGSASQCTHLVFANTDIVFDSSLEMAVQALGKCRANNVICLTRRELDGQFPQGVEPLQTQDAWILPQQSLPPLLLDQLRGVKLGVPGCEHLLASVLLAHGFNLWNPCEDLIAIHADPHPVAYSQGGERYWGFYVYVPPCRIAAIGHEDPEVFFAFSRAPGRYFPVSVG